MKKTISIKGMHCSHYAGLTYIQLYSIKEVVDVKVDIKEQRAFVVLNGDVENEVLIRAVEKAGYIVEMIR